LRITNAVNKRKVRSELIEVDMGGLEEIFDYEENNLV
jgi:hypothetical protein